MNSPTSSQIQQATSEIISGAVRSEAFGDGGGALAYPSRDDTTLPVLEAIDRFCRPDSWPHLSRNAAAVPTPRTRVHWQSVALSGADGNINPGIIVGSPINVQGAGTFEYYVVYSLEQQESTVRLVIGILTAGAVVLVLFSLPSLPGWWWGWCCARSRKRREGQQRAGRWRLRFSYARAW